MAKIKHTSKQISLLYDQIPRVSQERNDFLLPQIVDLVRAKQWMNIRPEYQRRLVWDKKKKSRFIESLLMNIPIPPIFLYEHELGRYEVMDGQQRVNTILEFYDNALKLTGLETWTALNGFARGDLPERILRGLERRRLSATVLLAESTSTSVQSLVLRRQVFERLNTGGLRLNAQELRNSVYGGAFNELLIELAGNNLFDDLWGIPRYQDHYDHGTGAIDQSLAENSLFKRMVDCEIVLRFFAFKDEARIKGSSKSILDKCMEINQNASAEAIDGFRRNFLRALTQSHRIFGKFTFQIADESGTWVPSQTLFDAVMISVDRLIDKSTKLYTEREKVKELLFKELKKQRSRDLLVGKPNTAAAIRGRISLIGKVLERAIQ